MKSPTIVTVPALIVVSPVYVGELPCVKMPLPFFVRPPAPLIRR